MARFLCVPLLLAVMAGCGDSTRPQAAAGEAAQSARRTGAHATGRSALAESNHQRPPEDPARPREVPVQPASDAAPPPQRLERVYRRSDDRPRHDNAALAGQGIHVYESQRIKLYTDVDPQVARTLPAIIDAAYEEWVRYFGPLPPDREGTEFQITGYLIADQDLFRTAGLIPPELPPIINGRHWNARFWMHDQPFDYYRRHLLIHEATHCFMTATREMQSLSPMWYIEGMAELFGTHRIEADGTVRFRVMPQRAEEVADLVRNLGRIEMVQQAAAEGRGKSLREVLELRPGQFSTDEAYAWSWALCKLLDTHPRYRDRFRQLGQQLTPRAFQYAFDEAFAGEMDELRTEWALFVDNLQHGYDVERVAIEFRTGTPLTGSAGRRSTALADRGWQSSGVRLEAGRTYTLTAAGRVTLADEPRPWISEPQGISFRYFRGRPLGQLLAVVRSDADPAEESDGGAASMLAVMPIGREATLTPAATGTLYLRVNDSWSELADNRGAFEVEIRAEQ